MNGNWVVFVASWFAVGILLTVWHVLSYVRVSVQSITRRIPYTLAGAFLALVLTGAMVGTLGIQNGFLVALVVVIGGGIAACISVWLHNRPIRKDARRMRKNEGRKVVPRQCTCAWHWNATEGLRKRLADPSCPVHQAHDEAARSDVAYTI